MSGIELLFIDGGGTVTSFAGVALSILGYRQRLRDDEELLDFRKLDEFLRVLQNAHAALTNNHGCLTAAWRGPISLFASGDACEAADRGVPAWAIACVRKAQRLVQKAAELLDFADVYEAQVGIAIREGRGGKGLLQAPLSSLINRLEDCARQLAFLVPYVELARAAFDSPADAVPDTQDDDSIAPQVLPLAPAHDANPEDLPIRILRDRGRVGELWRLQGEQMSKLVARLQPRNRSAAHLLLPVEVSSKLAEVRSSNANAAMEAAHALGRLGDSSPAREGSPELRGAVRRAAAEALHAVLEGGLRSPYERVRAAAVESLGRLEDSSAAPLLLRLAQSAEEPLLCRRLAVQVLGGLCPKVVGPDLLAALEGASAAEAPNRPLEEHGLGPPM